MGKDPAAAIFVSLKLHNRNLRLSKPLIRRLPCLLSMPVIILQPIRVFIVLDTPSL